MDLTPQNIEPPSGLSTSKLPSPNPEEANFETRFPIVESTQILRSITYIPTQIDNLAENANSNTYLKQNI